MKRILISLSAVLMAIALNSCLKANNPPSRVEDVNAGNTRIYGEEGSVARQMLQTYESLPDEIQRADKVRKILYPN